MKTNSLLHSFSRSYSHDRKNCAIKFVSMKSNRVCKYTAALFICMLISVANAWGRTVVFSFDTSAGLTELGISEPDEGKSTDLNPEETYSISPINMQITHGRNGKTVVAKSAEGVLRFKNYVGSPDATITFSSSYTITQICVVGGKNFTASTGTVVGNNSAMWTGSATSVTLTASANNTAITRIAVTYSTEGDLFTQVSSESEISDGDEIVITNSAKLKALSTSQGNSRGEADIDGSDGSFIYSMESEVQILSVFKDGDYYSFHDGKGFLVKSGGKSNNYLTRDTTSSLTNGLAKWSLSASSSIFTIQNKDSVNWYLRYNSDRFSAYKNSTANTCVFKKAPPTIVVTESFSAFEYSSGIPVTQTFSVNGRNLKADLTVEAPSNYQVSLDGNDWSGSKTITVVGSTLSSTTIYVRLAPNLAASSSYAGDITISSTEATSQTISVSGSVPYTITWKANNIVYETTYVEVGNILVLPDEPDPADYSCGSQAFYGWYGGGDSYSHETIAPSIAAEGDAVSANTTYHAVFATPNGNVGRVVVTYNSTNFPTSYGTANTFTEYTLEGYKFKIQQIYKNGEKMQWRAAGNENGTGIIYNTQKFPNTISSIVLIYHSSDANKNHTLRVDDDTENPTEGTPIRGTTVGNVETFDCSGGSYDYFVLTNGSSAGYTESITINYGSYSDFSTDGGGYAITLTNGGVVTGGTFSSDVQDSEIDAYACDEKSVVLSATPGTGYQFDSWTVYKTGDAKTTVSVINNAFTMPAYGVTVNATFAPLVYTLSYKDEGDVTYSGTNSALLPTSHTYNAETELVPGVRSGYHFDGWFTESDCTGEPITSIAANSISANTTLYAKWSPLYTIAWKVGGQNYTDGDPTTETTQAEGITTMPTPPADNSLGCANIFMGWSESELTGTGNSRPLDLFSTSGGAPTIDENKTFHAVFATGEATSISTTFDSYSWGNEGDDLWKSNADGYLFTAERGIQVTTSYSGAGATTNDSYFKVTSVVVTYSTNSSSGAGSIGIKVGKTDYKGDDVTTTGGTTDRPNTFTPVSPVSGEVNISVTCTTNSIFIKSVQINYNTPTNYMTYCTYTFTDEGEGHNWSTADNWSSGSLPTINDRATITKPVIVDITNAKAKNIVLDQSGDNNGTLTISPGMALVVAESVKKTTNGSLLYATSEEDIFIGSNLDYGTGALVMGDHNGTNQATVQFATKAKKTGGHNVNQFIGTPFNDEDYILYDYYNTKIYEFRAEHDGDKGNDNEWIRVSSDAGMTAFMGYNILTNQASSPTLEMTGTLNATNENVAKTLYYNGSSKTENMFANSWMAPIHIDAFSKEGTDFGGAEATIYIFNAGTPEDQKTAGDGSASASAAGQYIVLPVASAPWTEPTITVIPSMQAFSVYATGNNQTLTLDYNKLVYTPALTSVGVVPTRAPRRKAEESPEVIRLHVEAESGYAANAYVLGREDFSNGFDNGWDGRFMEGDAEAPQLYIPTEDGNMVISCIPEIEGTLLVFRKGTEDDRYTFSFEYEGEDEWYLNDMLDKRSVLIEQGNTYTFYSYEGDADARFIISASPGYNTPTDIGSGGITEPKARKLLIENQLYIIRAGKMYNATGIMVK